MPDFSLHLPPEAQPVAEAQRALADALAAFADGGDPQRHLAAARNLLAIQAQQRPVNRTALELVGKGSPLFALLADAHLARQEGRLPGLSLGVPALDTLLGGLRPGLTLVGAVPGGGKTALALNAAVAAARDGQRVVYLTADEPDERLALKAACIAAGLHVGQFVDGYRHPDDIAAALDRCPWLANIAFVSAHRLNVGDLRALTEGAGLLVADYVQALVPAMDSGANSYEMRHAVDALAAQLRDIATASRIPVLALSSLNRAGYGDPNMASLRESGGLEFSADVILLLHCEAAEAMPRTITARIQKNRYGRAFVESVLVFDPRAMTFSATSAAEDYALASGSTRRPKAHIKSRKPTKPAVPDDDNDGIDF